MIIMRIETAGFNLDIKGQMSLDYVIGVSIFILAFFFLLSVLSNLLLPFQFNSDETRSMADRISTVLVETSNGVAIGDTSPNIVDKDKIIQLNSDLNNNVTYESRRDQLGLLTSTLKYNINVSLLCLNNTLYPDPVNPILLGGAIPDGSSNMGQSVRIVYLPQDSKKLILVVKVWL
ncbi:MAG: hypothetical protein OIN87_03685 [Candidatus Methanoperedens sp.]|nr:hypothetical protein [Candidatus Methanoperedens sp.]